MCLYLKDSLKAQCDRGCPEEKRNSINMALLYLIIQIIFVDFMHSMGTSKMMVSTSTALERIQSAKQALEYVGSVKAAKCSGGTEEKLRLDFDHEPWKIYTDPAINTANLLTKIIAIDGDLKRFNEDVFYAMVTYNVQKDTLIFGSAIALEPMVYRNRTKYCPYAHLSNGTDNVEGFDIAKHYNYQQNTTEWYNELSSLDFTNITITTDIIQFNESEHVYRQPFVNYKTGRWTYPYFDCGGGNIWMATYSAPILAVGSSNDVKFKGVATIDIELTKLDINQCDRNDQEQGQALDVFRGTHNCQPTTVCVPLKEGFKSGAYECKCQVGYYFPNSTSSIKAFRGSEIDDYFESLNNSYANVALQFHCLKCARGCDSCIDSSPCLFPINTAIQVLVIFILSTMIAGCIVISIFILKYRTQMVIKTASPIFLQLMCLGAILMCASVFVMYGEVSSLACTVRNWPFHLGFIIMYGALLLKTWRISVIFKSGGTAKRVNLPDKALLQRMAPMIVVVVGFLAAWTVIDTPKAKTVTTTSNLKFFVCELNWWTYSAFGVEAILLLFGVYLCFTVRKAPAHFNESKFISWATYNAIILGSFVMMMTQFIGATVGPDGVFALMMLEQQVLVTITMTLIFGPKLWTLRKGGNRSNQVYSNQQVVTITGRVKQPLPNSSRFNDSSVAPSTGVETKNMAVQCNEEDFFLICGPKATESTLKVPTTKHHNNKVYPLMTETSHYNTNINTNSSNNDITQDHTEDGSITDA